MIGIIDYGMGNLRSVQKAFEHAGIAAKLTSDPRRLGEFAGLVLPGVGAFARAMRNLQDAGLAEALRRQIERGKPFLGICLGLQLLFEQSEEQFAGEHMVPGLAILPGMVRRFPPGLKIPQIGWNQITPRKESKLLAGIPAGAYFYFVHSYYVEPSAPQMTLTTTEYGIEFASMVAWQNVYAIQFHPEKSSTLGLRILKNFGEIVYADCARD